MLAGYIEYSDAVASHLPDRRRGLIVALGWRAFTLTGKASSLGIVLSVEALGLVTTLLIGGVLADRYSRRLLMIGSDVSRGLIVAGLALVDATGHLQFGVLIGFVALHGLGSGLFQPAFGGILPLLSRSRASDRRTR